MSDHKPRDLRPAVEQTRGRGKHLRGSRSRSREKQYDRYGNAVKSDTTNTPKRPTINLADNVNDGHNSLVWMTLDEFTAGNKLVLIRILFF